MNVFQKKYFAELLGTMLLVFLGCGTALFTNVDIVATAFAFGLSVVAMAYTIGNFSGCHINPAITFAAWLSKRISGFDAAMYVIFQFVGGIFGALLLYILIPETDGCNFGANLAPVDVAGSLSGNTEYFLGTAFFAEVIFTFIFVLVVLAVTDEKQGAGNKAGFYIGLTLVLVHLACIGVTGTSVNPARSFGPALFAGDDYLSQIWIFLLAPMIGAALSAGVWALFTDKIKFSVNKQ